MADRHLAKSFTEQESVGRRDHQRDFSTGTARLSVVDHTALVAEWIPALEGVEIKLRSGARVADIACGYGGATIMLAETYPLSTFCGFDYQVESIGAARRAAAEAGVSDRVTFEVVQDVDLPGSDYDLVCTFGSMRDMGDPEGVAWGIRAALRDDGTWLMAEWHAGDRAVVCEAGFTRVRQVAATPPNFMLEARP